MPFFRVSLPVFKTRLCARLSLVIRDTSLGHRRHPAGCRYTAESSTTYEGHFQEDAETHLRRLPIPYSDHIEAAVSTSITAQPKETDMATVGNVIKCKAAIAWEPGKPLSMEEIEVAPPKANEVRIKIVATGICGTEKQMLKGSETGLKFPLILGHEGAGIVESVGEGVTEVKPGDKVLTLALPQCRECNLCKNPDTNLCVKNDIGRYVGLMEDNTSRFTCRGKLIYHFVKTSTFTEYTVLPISSVVKIDDDAPLDRVCLIACGFSTGYGSVFNTAKVKPGSSCAVFGLGGVGFSIIKGCKAAGASRIIGINRSKFKFEKAKEVGATECLSTLDFERPIQEVLTEMSDGGIKYTFECTGNIDVMNEALQSCHIGLGTCVILGLPPTGQRMQVDPTQMLGGRTLKSSIFGGYKAKDDFPKLVSDFMAKKFDLEDLVSDTLPFEKVNEAFELMDSGKCVRCVLVFKDPE